MREVTERDLRMPEFRDAKPEDLEFREDGKLVRKDRWETGLRNVASIIGWTRKEWEIQEVVEAVRGLSRRIEHLEQALVYAAFMQHGTPQHQLPQGLMLIDNCGAQVKLPSGEFVSARCDYTELWPEADLGVAAAHEPNKEN